MIKRNNLIVIENGQLKAYQLDAKSVWKIGRISKDNALDIKLYSKTVSRNHGCFRNVEGIWFYVYENTKNGTIYNGKPLSTSMNGRKHSELLKDGDVLIFGGAQTPIVCSQTVWSVFLEYSYDDVWRVTDTKDYHKLIFKDGVQKVRCESLAKGTIVRLEKGIAIYMGDVTYLCGEIQIEQ